MADNIFASYDHIRVLYYEGLPCTAAPNMQSPAPLNITAGKLTPFLAWALQLVKVGYPIPVPFLTNHSPNGRLCYRMFHHYPRLAAAAGRMWLEGQVCDRLRNTPDAMFTRFVGSVPSDLRDVMEGRVGYPPGPDVNEVLGRPPQPCTH